MRALASIITIIIVASASAPIGRADDVARASGIDVSDSQGKLDWQKIAAAGRSFAIARVSDGANDLDTTFAKNWDAMRKAGLVRGAYQFFRPSQSGVDQARVYLAQVKLEAGDLPPFLDIEVTDGVDAATILKEARAWVGEIESKTGLTPLIYVSPGFWNGIGGAKPPAGVGLWVAHWRVSRPTIPRGFGDWSFWQYDDRSSLAFENGADVDVFNGSTDDLRAFAAAHGTLLKEGARGPAVAALQTNLTRAGYPVAIDAIFGPETRAQVVAFQTANGLGADGVVGPLTYRKLADASATARATPGIVRAVPR